MGRPAVLLFVPNDKNRRFPLPKTPISYIKSLKAPDGSRQLRRYRAKKSPVPDGDGATRRGPRGRRVYFLGMRSNVATTKRQYLSTLGMWQRSSGVWGERSVGPKLTMSIFWYMALMRPHSRPA